MTTATPNSAASGFWPSNKGVLAAAAVVLLVLAGGLAARLIAEHLGVVLVKPPAPLSKPLPDLARKIGPYEMVDVDQKLPEDVVQVLGTEDYLLRRYRDTRVKEGALGAIVALNLNYYASGSATPHTPDVCWAGNGLVQYANGFFEVAGVPHLKGAPTDIRMRRLSFVPKSSDPTDVIADLATDATKLTNVAYVFHVNGRYVSTTGEVSKDFWNPRARFAYHAKIELTLVHPNGQPIACDPRVAEPIFAEFLRHALPDIEACLPDPAQLNAAGSVPTTSPETRP
jgi:hypothetical protein